MRDLFLWAGPSLVLASIHIQSAWVPFVIHILLPLMTRSSVPGVGREGSPRTLQNGRKPLFPNQT